MTNRFSAIIILINMIMGLFLYLSSQLVLFDINSPSNNPVTVYGFNIFTIYLQPPQTGSGVILPIAWSIPNYPIFAFAGFLLVNVLFIGLLARKKNTK